MRYHLTLPQFTLGGVMLAVFWLSVCFAAWRVEPELGVPGPTVALVMNSFRYFPIPTAIGALFGHVWQGFFIGIGFYLCLIAVALFALAHSVP